MGLTVWARSWLFVREQIAFLVVLAGVAAGFVVLLVEPLQWHAGTAVVAVSLVLAALLRGALPSARAGLLVVRTRWFDVLAYLVLGGAILACDIRLRG